MTDSNNPLIPVTILKGWGTYAAGEVAGFDKKTVDQLVGKQIAELFYPEVANEVLDLNSPAEEKLPPSRNQKGR